MPRKKMSFDDLLMMLRRTKQIHVHQQLADHGWYIMSEPMMANHRGLCGTDRCRFIRLRVDENKRRD